MANAKDVHILAEVPFDWAGSLSDEDAALFARLTLGPYGLRLRYLPARERDVPNQHGGQTQLTTIWIKGIEAVRHDVLRHIVAALGRLEHGRVLQAHYADLDDPRGPHFLLPDGAEHSGRAPR